MRSVHVGIGRAHLHIANARVGRLFYAGEFICRFSLDIYVYVKCMMRVQLQNVRSRNVSYPTLPFISCCITCYNTFLFIWERVFNVYRTRGEKAQILRHAFNNPSKRTEWESLSSINGRASPSLTHNFESSNARASIQCSSSPQCSNSILLTLP